MTSWLIDKSALVRIGESPDAATWANRIERGLVRIAVVTRLEVGYSARSGPELRTAVRRPPLSAMAIEHMTPAIEDRAVEGDAAQRATWESEAQRLGEITLVAVDGIPLDRRHRSKVDYPALRRRLGAVPR